MLRSGWPPGTEAGLIAYLPIEPCGSSARQHSQMATKAARILTMGLTTGFTHHTNST